MNPRCLQYWLNAFTRSCLTSKLSGSSVMCVLMNPVTGSLMARYSSLRCSAVPGSAKDPLFRHLVRPFSAQFRMPLSSDSVVSFSRRRGSCLSLGMVWSSVSTMNLLKKARVSSGVRGSWL